MIRGLKNVVGDVLYYLAMLLKALYFWRQDPPVDSFDALVKFVETRSKFVAQTTLYGYIKTRAGTRYTLLFQDDVFVNSINIAKWEVYLACLSDLTCYAAARVGERGAAQTTDFAALATGLFDAATGNEETPPERPQGFDDDRLAFAKRARSTRWPDLLQGDSAFRDSPSALVEWAPIADELKRRDVEIVKNSIRFKWKKVRDQLDRLLDADSVLADWRMRETQP